VLQIRNVGDTKNADLEFISSIQGKTIYVKTLIINTEWSNIYGRLMDIAAVI